jgi:MYXO-CTERM domain-containing protein
MCGDNGDPCFSPVRLHTEDGRDVHYRPLTCMQYDRGQLDQLPGAEGAWMRDTGGEGQMVVDNRPEIMTKLAAHNATVELPGRESFCGCNMGGSSSGALLLLAAGGFAFGAYRRRRRR